MKIRERMRLEGINKLDRAMAFREMMGRYGHIVARGAYFSSVERFAAFQTAANPFCDWAEEEWNFSSDDYFKYCEDFDFKMKDACVCGAHTRPEVDVYEIHETEYPVLRCTECGGLQS